MVPASVVADVIEAVAAGAMAVTPVITLADSVRMIGDDPETSSVVDRSRLRAIQTPQGFPLDVIRAAHEAAAESGASFTDDVSCVEALGHPVTLIEGSRLAMKITEPTDLTVAKALWKVRSSIGHHSGRRILRHVTPGR
jgi:2-C-methyl-D-erythritol 4-phosphate cytidylyltransferase